MAMLINIIRISFFFRITNDHLAHSIAEFSFFLVSSLQKMPLEFNSFVRYHQ